MSITKCIICFQCFLLTNHLRISMSSIRWNYLNFGREGQWQVCLLLDIKSLVAFQWPILTVKYFMCKSVCIHTCACVHASMYVCVWVYICITHAVNVLSCSKWKTLQWVAYMKPLLCMLTTQLWHSSRSMASLMTSFSTANGRRSYILAQSLLKRK